MKIIKQIFIILFFYVLGEIISFLLKELIFIPGSIIGMVLLLLALIFRIVKIEKVETVATFLTTNMAFFFIPAVVSIIEYYEILRFEIIKILFICVVSILLTFITLSLVLKLFTKRKVE